MTTILLLLKQLPNLWFLVQKAPAVIAVIRMLIEAVGSETFQNILDAVKDVIKNDDALPVEPDKADPETKRKLLQRIKERVGIKFLDFNEMDYSVMQSVKNSRFFTSQMPGVHRAVGSSE